MHECFYFKTILTNAIPISAMATIKLPVYICTQMWKRVRAHKRDCHAPYAYRQEYSYRQNVNMAR